MSMQSENPLLDAPEGYVDPFLAVEEQQAKDQAEQKSVTSKEPVLCLKTQEEMDAEWQGISEENVTPSQQTDVQPAEAKEEQQQSDALSALKQQDFDNLRSTYDKRISVLNRELETLKQVAYRTLPPESIQHDPNEGIKVDWQRVTQKANPLPEKEFVQPSAPTQEEWEFDVGKAAIKQQEYMLWHVNVQTQKLMEDKESQLRQKEIEFAQSRIKEESVKEAGRLYPDYLNQNSELFKEGLKVAHEQPELINLPNADLLITQLAAARLGIPSSELSKKIKDAPKEQNIIVGGGNRPGKPATAMSEADFLKMDQETQERYLRSQYA